MRDYLKGNFCKEAYKALGHHCSFNDVLRFHDMRRFQLVKFGDGEEGCRYDYEVNEEFLEQHCEHLSKLRLKTGDFRMLKEDWEEDDYLVNGKDISLEISNSSLEMVVDVSTVTQADIEAVLQQFYRRNKTDKVRFFVLLENKRFGYYTQKKTFDNIPINLEDSYNEGFATFHQHLEESLRAGNGLILLHGLPGTGKTTYIKYLSSMIDRDFVFIPEVLADSINSPELLPVLLKLKRPIIVIEDAEKMLVSRSKSMNNSVSSILNLSSGILGDYINASVICTFNCDLQTIDKALLRKGRLIGNWEFGELDIDRCRKIAASHGVEMEITKPITVSEILNHKNTLSNTSNNRPYRINGFVTTE